MQYYIYIIKCDGDRLYTGITTDYNRRLEEHKGIRKKGAKFTKSFKPENIEALWTTLDRSYASKLEYRIKTLSKIQKNNLIDNNKYFKEYFNDYLDISKYKRKRLICTNI